METVDAIVVGAGQNGLVAANILADAGWDVLVLEAQPEPGGAVRSGEVAAPGFIHDRFSAFYPLAVASPVMREMQLEKWGVRFAHGPLVLAHPALDGTCAVLARDAEQTAASLEPFAPGDGSAWLRLSRWWDRIGPPFVEALFRPFPPIRAGGRLLAALGSPSATLRFARFAFDSVQHHATTQFRGAGAQRLLAGNAMHADVHPGSAGGALFAWMLCGLGQQVGWPCARGGAGTITEALIARLQAGAGQLRCNQEVTEIVVKDGRARGVRTREGGEVIARRAVLADVGAPALYRELLDETANPLRVRWGLRRFRYDDSTLKVDWALDRPIPWSHPDARRAPVVHVTEGLDGLKTWSKQLGGGLVPEHPFLLLGQYDQVDELRHPPGASSAWAYSHVPQRIAGDAGGAGLTGRWDVRESEAFADRMEAEVEALAPGFRASIRARHIAGPPDLQAADANLVNGAINGGTSRLRQQLVLRPIPGAGRAETHVESLYLASASAHPGGGVHGACGANAARAALFHAD